jgi:RNA polymerase sigma-70 factor (ECF subfamily)
MKKSVNTIWQEFSKELLLFIKARISLNEDAEDILQESFIKIHNNIDTLKNEQALKSWLYLIVKNTIYDFYKKKKIKTEFFDEQNYELVADFEKEEKDIQKALLVMVDNLPEKYKQALKLVDFEGFSQKQLAEKEKISLPAAKSRVQRARKMLKNNILDCCFIEYDSLGKPIDYKRKNQTCDACSEEKQKKC